MDFDLTERQSFFRDFLETHVRPRVGDYKKQIDTGDRWQPIALIEELNRSRALRACGIRTLRFADGPDEVHNRSIARNEFAKYAELPK